jgi:hypothetical protein
MWEDATVGGCGFHSHLSPWTSITLPSVFLWLPLSICPALMSTDHVPSTARGLEILQTTYRNVPAMLGSVWGLAGSDTRDTEQVV